MTFRQKVLRKIINFYPPFLGAGIKVRVVEWGKTIDVSMKLSFYNRNYVGTHFGGSLYAMCDPFYMLLLMENLGPGYMVWDRKAAIHFKQPGRGRVTAHFNITEKRITELRAQADAGEAIYPEFSVDVTDAAGNVVATVTKEIYIKKKDR